MVYMKLAWPRLGKLQYPWNFVAKETKKQIVILILMR